MDKSVSCNKHCKTIGYIAGQEMNDKKCRCRKYETTCGSDSVDSYKFASNPKPLCYYDVCKIQPLSVTKSGYTCQKWNCRTNNSCINTPWSGYQKNYGIDSKNHNHCEKLDASRRWCYIKNIKKRWDYCE